MGELQKADQGLAQKEDLATNHHFWVMHLVPLPLAFLGCLGFEAQLPLIQTMVTSPEARAAHQEHNVTWRSCGGRLVTALENVETFGCESKPKVPFWGCLPPHEVVFLKG